MARLSGELHLLKPYYTLKIIFVNLKTLKIKKRPNLATD